MASRTGTAHVVTTTRKYKRREYHTHLLRRSYREVGKVKNETLGNISHLPEPTIDLIRRSLKGERFVPADESLETLAEQFGVTDTNARDAWRELIFADTDQAAKATRYPVAPAQRSEQALQKVHSRALKNATEAHSIDTMMSEMGCIVRNTCHPTGSIEYAMHSFDLDTSANDKQRRAFELIKTISV